MVLLEAMFCGLACISTNVGEIESFIKNGENGFLLNNPDDVDMFTSILKDLLSNPVLLKKISKNAPLIANRYSINNAKEAWADCLKGIN